jgi:hypothetical protein
MDGKFVLADISYLYVRYQVAKLGSRVSNMCEAALETPDAVL